MPTVSLSPIYQWPDIDQNGDPRSGAQLFTYAAGSSTKQNTYTSSAGSVAHTNPIILSSNGTPPNPIFLVDGQSYKFVLAPPADTDPPSSPIRTIDNITGINDVAATAQSEWLAAAAPTVHPRVCGEQPGRCSTRSSKFGSSPRVRGTVQSPGPHGSRTRFIPACAGNRKRPTSCSGRITGSSPRVRGTDSARGISMAARRFIPACAGNSGSVQMCVTSPPVHPRVCGEQKTLMCGPPASCGSSPRVRGTVQ